MDSTSARLHQAFTSGEKFKEVTIHHLTNAHRSSGTQRVYMEYQLEDVTLTCPPLTSDGDRPVQQLSLKYTKMSMHPLKPERVRQR